MVSAVRILARVSMACVLAWPWHVVAEAVAGEGSGTAVATKRILFAGSSSTYWNDMPNEIAKAISTNGGMDGATVSADIVGRSGSDIRVYLDPRCDYQYGVKRGQSFLDRVSEKDCDYVVLQAVCNFITGGGADNPDGKAHAAAITKYCGAIRESGAEPVIYEMGWGRGDREADGRRRILELAIENDVRLYVPCSTAWERVRRERTELLLQHPDDPSHPGDLGHFLNVACFYAVLKNESPVGRLPRNFHVWPHLSKPDQEARKKEIDAAFAAFRPDAYQARLPSWMRRHAGSGFRGEVSEQDATYLEQVAWDTWNEVRPKLVEP